MSAAVGDIGHTLHRLPGTLPAGQHDIGPGHVPPTGMSRREMADQILQRLLATSGPIVINVTGTNGAAYDHAALSTLQHMGTQHAGPVTVVSIPYDSSIGRIATRVLGLNTDGATETLALVLRELQRRQPGRRIMVIGQSQGSWVISKVMADDPQAARAITRAVLFSKPAVAPVVDAQVGAGKVLEIAHTDDIVTGVPHRLRVSQLRSMAQSIGRFAASGDFEYAPHHYTGDARIAAEFLLGTALGKRSGVEQHASTSHGR